MSIKKILQQYFVQSYGHSFSFLHFHDDDDDVNNSSTIFRKCRTLQNGLSELVNKIVLHPPPCPSLAQSITCQIFTSLVAASSVCLNSSLLAMLDCSLSLLPQKIARVPSCLLFVEHVREFAYCKTSNLIQCMVTILYPKCEVAQNGQNGPRDPVRLLRQDLWATLDGVDAEGDRGRSWLQIYGV